MDRSRMKIYMLIIIIMITSMNISFAEENPGEGIMEDVEKQSVGQLSRDHGSQISELGETDVPVSEEKEFYNDQNRSDIPFEDLNLETGKTVENYRMSYYKDEYFQIEEREPNNSVIEANLIDGDYNGSENYVVYGTITDYSFDLDYYRIDVTTPGTFDILSYWVGDYYEFGWEDDLIFSLKDSHGDTIKWSSTTGYGSTKAQRLVADVGPGTYYLSVMQISNYSSLYVGEWYLLDIIFDNENIPVTGIQLNKDEITIDMSSDEGQQFLELLIQPENATDKTISWATSSPEVARISDNGMITPLSTGTTIITAVSRDGNFSDSCIVNIIDSEAGWNVWDQKYNVSPDKTWTVDFNKVLDIKTIIDNNIYITDQNSNRVPLFFYQLNGDLVRKIYIKPVIEYSSGEKYTLFIVDLRAKDGSILNKNVKMEFTIR